MRLLSRGDVLEGRYEVCGRLGDGGTSVVYLAFDRERGRNVALKETGRAWERLGGASREAALIERLRYPYFPEVIGMVDTGETCCIAMEFLEGETLEQLVRRRGPQPAPEVVKWARSLCLMLGYLHGADPPVLYLDMKPSNVMLQPGGNLRLLDFGAALEGGADDALRLGTKGYAAPEQLDGSASLDARADIYGLGATMYRLLTGLDPGQAVREPYGFFQWGRRVPARLKRIVGKCVRKDRGRRYATCDALREALGRL